MGRSTGRQRRPELAARADAELFEHLAQVILHRARADEQLGPDLGVRAPVSGEPGDLGLLWRENVAELSRGTDRRLTCGQEREPGALGEGLGTEPGEQVERDSQLRSRVG